MSAIHEIRADPDASTIASPQAHRKGKLDAEGIASFVSADDLGGMRPSLLTGAGGARLVVRVEDVSRALALLQAAPEKDAAEVNQEDNF